MPRKTRKQKERSKKTGNLSRQELVKREFDFSFSFSKRPITQQIEREKGDISPYSSTKSLPVRDLIKTALIAVGIISLELMLYFAKFK